MPAKLDLKLATGEPAWLDVTDFLDDATEHDLADFNWRSTQPPNVANPAIPIDGTRPTFELTCDKGVECLLTRHNNYSDRSWHAGWYRALFSNQLKLMRDLEENEDLEDWRDLEPIQRPVQETYSSTINLSVPMRKLDPKLDYDSDGDVVHGPACRCE